MEDVVVTLFMLSRVNRRLPHTTFGEDRSTTATSFLQSTCPGAQDFASPAPTPAVASYCSHFTPCGKHIRLVGHHAPDAFEATPAGGLPAVPACGAISAGRLAGWLRPNSRYAANATARTTAATRYPRQRRPATPRCPDVQVQRTVGIGSAHGQRRRGRRWRKIAHRPPPGKCCKGTDHSHWPSRPRVNSLHQLVDWLEPSSAPPIGRHHATLSETARPCPAVTRGS